LAFAAAYRLAPAGMRGAIRCDRRHEKACARTIRFSTPNPRPIVSFSGARRAGGPFAGRGGRPHNRRETGRRMRGATTPAGTWGDDVMNDHEAAVRAAGIVFADTFNVAVPFIDRHLDAGRAGKVAVRAVDAPDGPEVAVTYGELAEAVNRAGNAFAGLELARGDRIVLVVKDAPEFLYAFWGAIKAGFVPVPVNTLLRAKDLAFIFSNSGCAAVVYSPEFAGEVVPALAGASPAPAYALPVASTGGGTDFVSLMEAASDRLDAAPAGPRDDAFWLYSSGSTGTPKGAVHAHRDMVVTSQRYGVETIGVGAADIHLSAAKLFFAYGLGNAMTFPLWTGGEAVLFGGRPTPDSMVALIERFKPTLYFAVPTLYAAHLRALDAATTPPDLSSLRACVSAGEPLPAPIHARWKERTGLDILDGIGTTEILHIFISNRPGVVKPGSSGKLVPGYAARIVGDDGEDVATDEIGNLLIRGDSVISRYWQLPEKTAEALVGDGWIRTGDSYSVDAAGWFTCQGRSDDMLKVGGIWCSPVEIEARLVAHDAVLEAAIVGRADADGLVKPEAWVILKDPKAASDALAAELASFCREGLARYKYPRWVNFVDELPKTATGKIQRFRLREAGSTPRAGG
jgi:benzoate-CoA ligase family protein